MVKTNVEKAREAISLTVDTVKLYHEAINTNVRVNSFTVK